MWASRAQHESVDVLLDHFGVAESTSAAFEGQVGSSGSDLRLLAALPKVALITGFGNTITASGGLSPMQANQVGLVWRLARRVMALYKSGISEEEFVDVGPWQEATAESSGDKGRPEPQHKLQA